MSDKAHFTTEEARAAGERIGQPKGIIAIDFGGLP